MADPATIDLTDEDRARIAALLGRLLVASRESLLAHALRLGLTLLERDPLATASDPPAPSPPVEGDAPLLEAARAYAVARQRAAGRALAVARAREALDHAVDDWLLTRAPRR